MVKKKRSMGRVRKKSTTTTNADEGGGAKRSKTEEAVSNVKNKLASALKAMIDSRKVGSLEDFN